MSLTLNANLRLLVRSHYLQGPRVIISCSSAMKSSHVPAASRPMVHLSGVVMAVVDKILGGRHILYGPMATSYDVFSSVSLQCEGPTVTKSCSQRELLILSVLLMLDMKSWRSIIILFTWFRWEKQQHQRLSENSRVDLVTESFDVSDSNLDCLRSNDERLRYVRFYLVPVVASVSQLCHTIARAGDLVASIVGGRSLRSN